MTLLMFWSKIASVVINSQQNQEEINEEVSGNNLEEEELIKIISENETLVDYIANNIKNYIM